MSAASDGPELMRLLERWKETGESSEVVCADRPELIEKLKQAIADYQAGREQLPTVDASESTDIAFQPTTHDAQPTRPSRIGPYHILGSLGAGGMGEVYKAEQRTPIKRTVAIKIIKLEFDSREVIARFESERQALARMDHPNVARVLDAGVSDTGRPYFVMEYVPGKPITQFCDDNKLSIKDRLLLFTQACEAIGHAHTKAIIHRDIKAANVLAFMHDGKPTVKVIDFGIAKALTGDRLTDATFNTDAGRIIGTYDSMSPEQASGDPDIDTRTDVYSLGVLLYELLTGAKPFDSDTLAKAAHDEIRRIIREVDPPRPSTRLSALGQNASKLAGLRQSRVDALAKQLRSELEWIPLKAMRKERARRYSSPSEISQDIVRYLTDSPLSAGPESRAYRAKKFAIRNYGRIAAICTLLSIVVAGTGFYFNRIRAEQVKTSAALAEALRQKLEAETHRTNLRVIVEQMYSTARILLDAQQRDAESARSRLVSSQVKTIARRLETFDPLFADRIYRQIETFESETFGAASYQATITWLDIARCSHVLRRNQEAWRVLNDRVLPQLSTFTGSKLPTKGVLEPPSSALARARELEVRLQAIDLSLDAVAEKRYQEFNAEIREINSQFKTISNKF